MSMLVLADARAIQQELDGIGRFSLSVLRALCAREESPRIKAIVSPRGAGHLQGLDLSCIICDAPRFGLAERLEIPSLVRETGPDIYLNFSMAGPVVGVSSIITVHDLMVLDLPAYFGPGRVRNTAARALFKLLLGRSISRASAIAVPTSATLESIGRYFGEQARKAFIVGEGQDLFVPPAPPSVPRGSFFLYVGNARAYKNLPRLLAAYERLAGHRDLEIPPLQMVVRRDRAFDQFHKLLKASPVSSSITVLSGVSEERLRELYETCMALVMPSLCEGFGLPALEAMACGTPVLGSVGTALEEVIGDAGVLVDPLSVESISGGMRRLAVDPELRKSLSASALKRAAGFTWDRTADRLMDRMRELTGA